jgi:hypothetical protein
MSAKLCLTLVILCTATACAVKTEKAGGDSANVDTAAVVTQPAQSTPAAPATPAPAPPDTSRPAQSTSWTVTEAGIGPIHVGMTVAQANAAIGGGFSAPSGSGDRCTYAVLTKAPKGLAVMLDKGKVARVEVRSGDVATANGARIGDSELKVMALYSGKVTTTPHKYLPNGHYMTVAPSAANNRIVFETDGSKVINYRSGQQPQVEYVERCG